MCIIHVLILSISQVQGTPQFAQFANYTHSVKQNQRSQGRQSKNPFPRTTHDTCCSKIK